MIALALGGRTVAEWQSVMTRTEFEAWGVFYELYPFDDFHRFHRPAAMVASAMGGGPIEKRLDWLQPKPVVKHARYDEASMRSLAAFGIKPPKE